MPYDIELMCVAEDFYDLLEQCADNLNRVQDQFRIRTTEQSSRQHALNFRRPNFVADEIFDALEENKNRTGGNRQNIIAFCKGKLSSKSLGNLFGSHRAEKGLAIVSLHDYEQYVRAAQRYCSYFVVRYCHSFVNPTIKVHDDPLRTYCYFHKKMRKAEIMESMNSGMLCNICANEIDQSGQVTGSNRLSSEEAQALIKMREFVAGDLPYTILMKGGGVKGLAFAGALIELESRFYFDRHVGTSAGSIAAALLGADYTPTELKDIFLKKDFLDFLDAKLWHLPKNLIFSKGLYPGEAFKQWIEHLLHTKIDKQSEIAVRDLKGVVIYAAKVGSGALKFDSAGSFRDTAAAIAVRCSMSIPYIFKPMQIDGERVYDGGTRNNFPLQAFINEYKSSHFIALYLVNKRRPRNLVLQELFDIFIDGEERRLVDQFRQSVVKIDTSPIGTVDFKLTMLEKDFLVAIGRASALKFLYDQNIDGTIKESEVAVALDDAEQLRKEVILCRRRSRRSSLLKICSQVFATILIIALSSDAIAN